METEHPTAPLGISLYIVLCLLIARFDPATLKPLNVPEWTRDNQNLSPNPAPEALAAESPKARVAVAAARLERRLKASWVRRDA
jgi:hypothetical protein